jgi:hypothetical protein
MKLLRSAACAVVCVVATLASSQAATPEFRVGIELSSQTPVSRAVEASLRDMGISYINYYVNTHPNAGDLPAQEVNRAMMDLCASLNADFSISCHMIDPPDECVRAAKESGKSRFRGIVFDELEHCRLLNNYSPTPIADSSRFDSLTQAHDETLAGYRKLRSKFADSPVTATHMWPLLDHTAAQAGYIVCPKICKELYSPVSLAIGMGAAKQYGTELWADCDLWFWDLIPGHPPEEMKSNLLLAYWLGADLIYVEGAGYNLRPAGKQGTPFSLMNRIDADAYQLTPHGETLKWFCREYVPSHPRKWTFRDVKPSIVIIRYEDTCHGQRYTGDWKDNLYGSEKLHSTPDTEAWLGLWNLLTFGKTGRDGLSLFKAWVGPSGYQRAPEKDLAASYLTRPVQADMHRFFVPLNGVVVYDHTAGFDLLRNVPLIFVTGTQVSDETMAAVTRRVQEGATCVAWGPLAEKHGFTWESGVSVTQEGKGKLVLTDDFGVTGVYQEVKTLIGRPDEIRYRFGDSEVVLRRVTDNEVAVELAQHGPDR